MQIFWLIVFFVLIVFGVRATEEVIADPLLSSRARGWISFLFLFVTFWGSIITLKLMVQAGQY